MYLCSPGEVCDPLRAGDEATLLSRRFPNLAIAVADKKWDAVDALQKICDVIIVDDGLQRYDIPISYSIATVNCQYPDGFGWLLPRGLLREPCSRLSLVDAIFLTYPPSLEQARQMHSEYLQKYQTPTCVLAPRVTRYFSPDGASVQLSSGSPVALFSGMAYPDRFRRMMLSCGMQVLDHKVFSDHCPISYDEIERYASLVRSKCSDVILIGTEKDWARMEIWPSVPVVFVQIDFEVLIGSCDPIFSSLRALFSKKQCLYTRGKERLN
jgi:tetraacyldisaccharide 4'-kinase